MPKLFDTHTGELFVGEDIVLRKNLTMQEITIMGLMFNKEIDVGTGWVHRTTGPHLMSGRLAYLSLDFENESLKDVRFSFVQKTITNVDDLHKIQDRVLMEELGVPDKKNEWYITYDFPWGGIESGLDPRGGACSIIIVWN